MPYLTPNLQDWFAHLSVDLSPLLPDLLIRIPKLAFVHHNASFSTSLEVYLNTKIHALINLRIQIFKSTIYVLI